MRRLAAPPDAGAARVSALLALALAVLLGALDLTVVATLLPQMILELGIPLAQRLDEAAWIVHAYLVAYAVALPLMGRASDLYGRRPVLAALLALFLLGSLLVARAGQLGWVVAGRALQGFGAGALVPVALAAGGDLVPQRRRPVVYGLVAAVDTLGWVLGPLYGSLFLAYLDWRAVFYVNLPLGLLVLLLAWRALGHGAGREAGRLDWPGAALAALLLAALTLAFSGPAAEGPAAFAPPPGGLVRWPLLALGVGALVALLVWLRRAPEPLVPPALFFAPAAHSAAGVNVLLGAGLMVVMVDVPVFVHAVLAAGEERASTLSGLLLSAFTLPMAATSYLGGRLTARAGYRLPAGLGLLLFAGGLGLMARWTAQMDPAETLPGLLAAGLGAGLVVAPVASAVITQAPPGYRGVASSLVVVLRLMGMTLGLAALTAWGLRRFHHIVRALPAPPLGDPGFAQAVAESFLLATTQTLGEIFLLTAGLLLLGLLLLPWLGDTGPNRAV